VTSHPYVITEAQFGDLERIVEIYNSIVPGRMVTADLEPVTVESRRVWFEEHNKAKKPIWVMKFGDEVVAWFSFSTFYNRPAYDGTAEISIYVAEDRRGQGIGRILIEKALAESPRLGFNTLLGFVFGHNEPSLKLLQKFGFESWGHLPRVANLDGVERDLIILGKRI
jgi:L-amino acid N-acyltransferase YncA